ncbi:glycerol-3-phosphate 1-O-acyltransferase PlsY [Marivibrio halodurans]|uniref:Glycerol-3-phosphate acyltransferase n=1 Tax=Marivibrio halodurans TaxID=2039722 RepID=A0A8J7S1I6_9PROT|nr:glycerol-3-phosphate 1-O-acyltransferase PlsY [Marivibrio halodurans]MBP5856903.1 glycerol-3-phosphate 1-O-acyltransferase PlsY [Marivibrio halodurans]
MDTPALSYDTTAVLTIALVWGYLLGSIPFGLVLTRIAGLGDIRAIGSGNIGATNVLRTGRKGLAAAVLILDAGKGAVAVLSVGALLIPAHDAAVLAGVAAVLGHNFPVWLGYKGGKGVATTLGTLTAIAWPVGLGACATWLVVAALFRYSSLAALVSLAAAPVYALLLDQQVVAAAAGLLAVLAWARHHQNIARLLKGEESRIGGKKSG